jgi:hypothetical protein
LVFDFAILPVLRKSGIEVGAPLYPWRLGHALEAYREVCVEQGIQPRPLRIMTVLDVIGLAALLAFAATLLVSAS